MSQGGDDLPAESMLNPLAALKSAIKDEESKIENPKHVKMPFSGLAASPQEPTVSVSNVDGDFGVLSPVPLPHQKSYTPKPKIRSNSHGYKTNRRPYVIGVRPSHFTTCERSVVVPAAV